MAERTNFDIGQGETFKILLHIYSDRLDPTGSVSSSNEPMDLTNVEFKGQLRENYTTDEIAAQFDIIKLTPYESGSVFVYLYPADTVKLNQRYYVYDIVMINNDPIIPTPIVSRILEGTFTIRPAATYL